ncbi:IS3 family transposase, partial [Lactobacillus sp. XV13L]|nr:IS3 family transposase [Lactobacillus sp. XV13L]
HREKHNRIKINSLAEMRVVLRDYVYWFNHIRRSNKLKYATPSKYRNCALGPA